MRVTALLLIAVVGTPLLQRVLRETNSHAATARGVAAFERGDFARAANDLAEAERISGDQRSTLNRGTAEIAAGRVDSGIEAMSRVAADPRLREDALYNRGTAFLGSQQTDRAIADLEETLRINPQNVRAKRNLEIALRRKQQEQDAAGGSGDQKNQQQSGAGQQQQQQQPAPSQNPSTASAGGQANLEAILQSVAQQEREEMRRMRQRARGERGNTSW